ncbi:MAG: hypothetical protein GX877_06920 [Bacteroidales bacterium]|nr:hypothetical protein [Bacteroidales bacterium]
MKRIITSFIIVSALLFTTGCEDEPFIKAEPQTVSFPQEGGVQNIQLSTNSISWTASVSGKGFSVSPSSGSGNTTLQLKAVAATSSSDVTATLTVKSGTMQTSVSITQSARNTLILKGTNVVDARGGSYSLQLEYNTNYSVEVEASAKSWIQYTGTRALSTATLDFLIASNPGAPRSGKVEVRDNAGIAQTQTFVFEQKESELRSVLMELYNTLDGANWKDTKKTHWNTNQSIDTWGGVTLEEEKLTELDLSGFLLKGVLPAGLGSLADLRDLDVSSNPELTGALPGELGNLTALETLKAETTGLEGPLSGSLGNLNKLKVLLLSHNNIEGPLPKEWAGMTALESFDISHAKLKGSLPSEIFNGWKHLHTFKINDNPHLEGSLPKDLGQLETSASSLKLHWHNCSFEGGIPEEWGNLPDVCNELFVYGNKLTEQVPLSIQGHPSWTEDKWDRWVEQEQDQEIHGIRTQQDGLFLELEQVPDAQRECLMTLYDALDGVHWTKGKHWGSDLDIDQWEGVTVADSAIVGLHLSGFGLKGKLPSCLGELTSLKTIDVSNNPKVTGTLPKQLEKLPNLTLLKASETGLEGPLPASLGNLKKLTHLQLDHTEIDGTVPKEWAGMIALESFDISHAKLSKSLPSEIFSGWKHLHTFKINNNPHLKGDLPQALGELTTSAQSLALYLHECNFTGGIPLSWAGLPIVTERLSVYGNQLTHTIPAALIEHPCWEQWDAYKDNSNTHYIRSQQNNVFLDVENVLPTVSEITISKLLYNEISVSATVERQGSHPVTDRGIILNTTSRRMGSGPGTYQVSFKDLDENTLYTVKAYATSNAGTAYSPELTVTTPLYNRLTLVLTDDKNEPVQYAKVYLKQLSEETQPHYTAQRTAKQAAPKKTSLRIDPSQTDVLQSAAQWLSHLLKPYRAEVQKNLHLLRSGKRSLPGATPRPVLAANAQASGIEYDRQSSFSGQVLIEDIEPGTYGVRITEAYGILKDFYTIITVPEGKNTIAIENISTLPSTSQTMSLFKPNAGIRPFASPTPNDHVVALVHMENQYVRQFKGKILENIMLCPADTTASILIAANSDDQLEEIFEAFLIISKADTGSTQSVDPMQFIDFIENLSKHVIMIENVIPGRTNLVSQSEHNFKRIMIDGIKEEGKWDSVKDFFTESYVIKLEEGHSLLLNLVLTQQELHPVLMTDGEGPPVPGGNLIGLMGSSQENTGRATTLEDLGYNGNWHLGVTVRLP